MTTEQQRIAELEDALKEKERRIQELKADLDKANDLLRRQDEYVRDAEEIIQSWIDAFGMALGDNGKWQWDSFVAKAESWHDQYAELVRKWNRFVPEYNATVTHRNVGRPLAASEAQRQTALKLRGAGKSLRAIAEETNLGLNTVRTIVDQADGVDRTTTKHLERIRREMGEERTWQSRKRVRHSLPRRIHALQEQAADLHKEAKGLK